MLMIMASQITGAVLGVILVSGGIYTSKCNVYPAIALLCPADYNDSHRGSKNKLIGECKLSDGQFRNLWIVETVVTFIFATLVLNVKYHYGHNKAIINCLIVGWSLSSLVGISAGITGGCINPAIGLV